MITEARLGLALSKSSENTYSDHMQINHSEEFWDRTHGFAASFFDMKTEGFLLAKITFEIDVSLLLS